MVLQKSTNYRGETGYFLPFYIYWEGAGEFFFFDDNLDIENIYFEDLNEDYQNYYIALDNLYSIQTWKNGDWVFFDSPTAGRPYFLKLADADGVFNEDFRTSFRFRIVDANGQLIAPSQVKCVNVQYNEAENYFYFDTSGYTLAGQSGGNTNQGGSSGSSGSSSGESASSTREEAPAAVTASQATASAQQAIDKALAADENATAVTVKVRNADSISAAALRAIASVAALASADKDEPIAPIVHADVVKDGKVESRLYIDPTQVPSNAGEIKLGVTLGDQKVEEKFDRFFDNKVAVVKFDQAGSFGMTIKAAVKLDLTGFDTKTLHFYSYDAKTNTYSRITAPAYYVDANGYLHFTTSVGNNVIITDKPLARK